MGVLIVFTDNFKKNKEIIIKKIIKYIKKDSILRMRGGIIIIKILDIEYIKIFII